jgi:hypothetical protein
VPEARFELPEDLTGLTDDELSALAEQAIAAFDEIYETEGGPAAADVARAAELADKIEKINGEKGRREQANADAQATLAELRGRVHGDPTDPATGDNTEGDGTDDADDGTGTREPALVADGRQGGAVTAPRELGGLNARRGNLNVSLRSGQDNAPAVQLPGQTHRGMTDMVITAAAATSGAPIGSEFRDIKSLARFLGQHAKSLSVTNGNPSYTPFATIQHRYPKDMVLGENIDPATVEQRIKALTDPSVLVAAGGWCAPSEVRYDFFNVACQDRSNLVDMPTIGIDRGGVRWPTSPSLADVFATPAAFAPFNGTAFNATSMPWLWSEADDVAAVTGTGTKPCIRIPCASFNESRLECFGYCVTAGNLADSAFPEATENFLSLLMAAQIRVENFRYIAQMVGLSTLAPVASGGYGAAGTGVVAPVLGALELSGMDYRSKYGMCDTDPLELVAPKWLKGAIRSDLAKRTGLAMFDVTDQMIANWMDSRGVRVQFVGEYQERTAGYPGYAGGPILTWPTQVEFMLYAPGTFVRGDGMSLDLGVVRDSVLNKTNDHTAAWAEECHLIAKFGNESRRVIVNICPDGTTGAADLTACGV